MYDRNLLIDKLTQIEEALERIHRRFKGNQFSRCVFRYA